MKIGEIKTKTKEELQKLLMTLRDNLRTLKFQHSRHELKDTSQIKKVKKDIARILTILKLKSLK